MVLVSKEEKRAIYTYLLKEGVVVVKKDGYLTKHQQIESVHNLKVMMIVKSLKSRGYLNDVYSWKWSYYTVTNAGVAYLAKSLGVSSDVVPATYKKKRAVTTAPKVEEDDEKAVVDTPVVTAE